MTPDGDVARDFIEVKLHHDNISDDGSDSAAPTPRAGQIATNR